MSSSSGLDILLSFWISRKALSPSRFLGSKSAIEGFKAGYDGSKGRRSSYALLPVSL
jgi:hypothetical protein